MVAMTTQQQFRLSYFHLEIARLIGEGLPNREIKKVIQISDSRLSILRANPLVRRAAERYKQLNEDKYRKALEVFADNAAEVATAVVQIAKNPLGMPATRIAAAELVFDKAAQISPAGQQAGQRGGEESFEMLLKYTKRGTGQYEDDHPVEYDPDHTTQQLLEDAAQAQADIIEGDFVVDEPDTQQAGSTQAGSGPAEPSPTHYDDVNTRLVV